VIVDGLGAIVDGLGATIGLGAEEIPLQVLRGCRGLGWCFFLDLILQRWMSGVSLGMSLGLLLRIQISMGSDCLLLAPWKV
jgi:hypothetical protein